MEKSNFINMFSTGKAGNNELFSNLNLNNQFGIEKEYNGYILYKGLINGGNKFCIKKKGEKISETDFIFDKILFDDILWNQEINGKFYYRANIGDKTGYIELGKEGEYKEKIIFDNVGDLEKINGKFYYRAKIGDKTGYIELGKEGEYKEKIIFKSVWMTYEINGKIYYQARIGGKCGYIEYGKEGEYKEIIIFDDIGRNLKKINGKFYYLAKIGNKWGYIEFGKESEYKEKIIFDEVGNLIEINGKKYYEARIGNKWGYIEFGKEGEYKEKIIFDYVCDLIEINGKLYYKVIIGNKYGLIEYDNEDGCENVIIFDNIFAYDIVFINGKIRYRVLYGKSLRYVQMGEEYKLKQSIFRKLTSLVNQIPMDRQRLAIEPTKEVKMLGNTDGFMQQLEKIYEEMPQHYDVDLNYNDQYLIEGKLILQKPSTLSENEWKQFLENFDTELEIVISGCNYYQLKSIIDDYEIKLQKIIEKIKDFN